MRSATAKRTTNETDIAIQLSLTSDGETTIDTGIGFFDHMLTLFAFHGGFSLQLKAQGDLHVCDHHIVEDCGILLGDCFREALGDKIGIQRYGHFMMVMDETLAQVTLDISNRAYLVYHCAIKRESIGSFSCEMVPEFLRAFANHAGITLHVNVPYGTNDHHKIEAIFKALGRALKEACAITSDQVPSTKGVL